MAVSPPILMLAMKKVSSQHSPYFNLYHHNNSRTQKNNNNNHYYYYNNNNFISNIIQNLCYSWWFFFIFLILIITTESTSTILTSTSSTTIITSSCSSRQIKSLQFEDAGSKAYIAQVVFKGLIKFRTPVDQQGLYEASFLIQQPIKGFAQLPKKKRRRVQFASSPMTSGGTVVTPSCRHGVIAANLDTNVTYLVFADRAGGHQLRVLAPPLPATRRHEDAVEKTLCNNCARTPSVSGLHDVTVRAKQRLRLTCRYDGNPPPNIEWYRRGRRIEPSKRAKIVNKKRRSVLTIPRASRHDAGSYECRAVSVSDEKACTSAHVTITAAPGAGGNEHSATPHVGKFDNATLWPLVDAPCPISSYCLNGGTCLYYEAVGELVCECAEGYKGQRCESKDVYNRGKRRRTSCCGARAMQQQQQRGSTRPGEIRRRHGCEGAAACSQRRRRLRGAEAWQLTRAWPARLTARPWES